jgi:hypothetical protein
VLRGEARKKICRCSGSAPEFVKDAFHRESQVLVVAIDGSWILSSARGGDVLSGGEQRFDRFLS